MFELAKIFTDSMVLQRDKTIKIFGIGDESVTVSFDKVKVTASPVNGKWCASLPPHSAGGLHTLTVTGQEKTVVLSDILVGDVWIASGQSNMEMPLLFELRGIEAAKASQNDSIRLYTCNRSMNTNVKQKMWVFEKCEDGYSPWKVCNEENVLHFSSIGYYTAMLLNERLKIPIGIISANQGASVIDSWVPEKAFDTEAYKPYYRMYERTKISDNEAENAYMQYVRNMQSAAYNDGITMEDNIRQMGIEAAAVRGTREPIPLPPLCRYSFNAPSNLYNAIIKGQVAPMSVKGVLWYQGESSRTDRNYGDKFKLLAQYWREAFEDEKMPFYTVEIAPFEYAAHGDTIPNAAFLRAQQHRAAEITEYTYISSTQDLGDEFDIHPNRKYEISKRIVNQIFNYTYGLTNYCESPSFESFEIKDGRIYITLKNDDGFFGCDNGENMKICGKDGIYVPAESKYENGRLVVWSEGVPEPENVRYCFDSYYKRGRYFNKAGLPLAPFTTEKL